MTPWSLDREDRLADLVDRNRALRDRWRRERRACQDPEARARIAAKLQAIGRRAHRLALALRLTRNAALDPRSRTGQTLSITER